MRDALTAKQRRFVDEFSVDLNATRAAIRAGYSEKTAAAIGNENLRKPQIAEAIEEAMAIKAAATGFNKVRVVEMALAATESAKQAGNHAAWLRGVELLAKLHGHIVERRDTRQVRSFEDLTDDDLAALVADGERSDARH